MNELIKYELISRWPTAVKRFASDLEAERNPSVPISEVWTRIDSLN